MTQKAYPYKLVPLDSIVPYDKNPRTHSEAQIEQLRASIREFGFTNPLLIDEQNRLIAGHGRLLAAQAEAWTVAPAIVITGLSDMQRRALIIADNKLALNSGWDNLLLSTELSAMLTDGADLEITGFDAKELSSLMGSFNPVADGEQSHLDKTVIVCPNCGHEFERI